MLLFWKLKTIVVVGGFLTKGRLSAVLISLNDLLMLVRFYGLLPSDIIVRCRSLPLRWEISLLSKETILRLLFERLYIRFDSEIRLCERLLLIFISH